MPTTYGSKTQTTAQRVATIKKMRQHNEIYSGKIGRNLGAANALEVPIDDPNWSYRWVDFQNPLTAHRNVERRQVWQMEICKAEEMIRKYDKDFSFSSFKDGEKIIKMGLTLCRFPMEAAKAREFKMALESLSHVTDDIKLFEKEAGNNLRAVEHVSSRVDRIDPKKRAVTVQPRPQTLGIGSTRGTVKVQIEDPEAGGEDDE